MLEDYCVTPSTVDTLSFRHDLCPYRRAPAVLMLEEILKPTMSTGIIATLKPEGLDANIFLLNFLSVFIASHMFLKVQSTVDGLAGWAGVPHFQTRMKAVEACHGESDSPKFWREQGSFLISEGGQAYMDNLEAARKKLCRATLPHR